MVIREHGAPGDHRHTPVERTQVQRTLAVNEWIIMKRGRSCRTACAYRATGRVAPRRERARWETAVTARRTRDWSLQQTHAAGERTINKSGVVKRKAEPVRSFVPGEGFLSRKKTATRTNVDNERARVYLTWLCI